GVSMELRTRQIAAASITVLHGRVGQKNALRHLTLWVGVGEVPTGLPELLVPLLVERLVLVEPGLAAHPDVARSGQAGGWLFVVIVGQGGRAVGVVGVDL